MDRQTAAKILDSHNVWRRGVEGAVMGDPKELGEALEVAVVALRTPSSAKHLPELVAALKEIQRHSCATNSVLERNAAIVDIVNKTLAKLGE